MARSYTASEVKARNIDAMGDDLGNTYTLLWNKLAKLHSDWALYVEFFGTNEDRVRLVNQAAPRSFHIIQDTLWEAVFLGIARLTDPVSTGTKKNLTIQRLAPLVDHPDLKATTLESIEAAKEKAAFCRDWRNRRIAHDDFDLANETAAVPLAAASRFQVREALEALVDVLNVLSGHYLDSTTTFKALQTEGDAGGLLYIIRDGLKAEADRHTRLREGNLLPEDLAPPEPL